MNTLTKHANVLRPFNLKIKRRAAQLSNTSRMERAKASDQMRSAASVLARFAAANCDQLWKQADTAQRGAIDVVDIFCGCGGMSAGFRAFNAITPTYRLRAAVDIDRWV